MKERFETWLAPQGDGRREAAPLRQLGWAFLLAWVFCVFYTNAAETLSGDIAPGTSSTAGISAGSSIGAALFYAVLPLAASVATLMVVVLAEPRIGSPTSHRSFIAAAPLLTAASTPFMFVSMADPALNALLFGVGAVATGIGSALLWVMWGEYYAVIPRDRSELLAPVSAVSAAIIVLLVSAMDGWVSIAVASALPLLSGLCFWLVWTPEAARAESALASGARSETDATARRPLAGLGRTGFGILVVFAIVSIAGMTGGDSTCGAPLQAILMFSALMMAVVAIMAVSGPRRISLFFLYRWLCPTLVIGFAAVILFGREGALVATAASLGGRFTFCLIAQIYFANYARAGRATPAQASSLGWLFVHAGDLIGGVVWILAEPAAATPEGLVWTSVACIVALVTITMALMGNASTFLQVPERTLPDETPIGHGAADSNDAATARRAEDAPSSSGSTGNGGVTQAHETESEAAAIASNAAAELAASDAATVPTDSADAASAFNTAGAFNTSAPAGAFSTIAHVEANTNGAKEPDPAKHIGELARSAGLTPRETEVFALLAQGRSIPYIRDELIISRETAATHAKHIYAKLGVHSRQELIDLVQQ